MLRKTLLFTLFLTLFLTACGAISPSSGNLTFTDGLGREVKLAAPAQHRSEERRVGKECRL